MASNAFTPASTTPRSKPLGAAVRRTPVRTATVRTGAGQWYPRGLAAARDHTGRGTETNKLGDIRQ